VGLVCFTGGLGALRTPSPRSSHLLRPVVTDLKNMIFAPNHLTSCLGLSFLYLFLISRNQIIDLATTFLPFRRPVFFNPMYKSVMIFFFRLGASVYIAFLLRYPVFSDFRRSPALALSDFLDIISFHIRYGNHSVIKFGVRLSFFLSL